MSFVACEDNLVSLTPNRSYLWCSMYVVSCCCFVKAERPQTLFVAIVNVEPRTENCWLEGVGFSVLLLIVWSLRILLLLSISILIWCEEEEALLWVMPGSNI